MEWYLKVLRQYADFEGRSSRREYWMFVLFNVIFSFVVSIIGVAIVAVTNKTGAVFLAYMYMFAVLLPGIAVTVRRLHDTGKSAWFLLINLIPLVGGIWMFVLMLLEGTPGRNRYGDDPEKSACNTGFNKTKSVAVTLIISAFAWLLSQLLSGHLLAGNYMRMFYLIPSIGMIITGFIWLQERKLTANVAYALILTSVAWFIIEIFTFQSAYLNFYMVVNKLVMLIPAAFIVLGVSVLQRKDYRNIAAVLLITGVCIWVFFILRNTVVFSGFSYGDVSDYLFLMSNIMGIILPTGLFVLAMFLLSKEADVSQTEEKNFAKTPHTGNVRFQQAVTAENRVGNTTSDSEGTRYYERDNKGMRVDTFSQSVTYWMVERFKNPRKDPFVYYVFKNENDARTALLELPFIHTAVDTNKLICDELFRFGYFAVTNDGKFTGEYDAFVAGSGFTHDLWQKTHAAFTKHHGVKKNDLEPEKNTTYNRPVAGHVKNVVFVREDRDNNSIWVVYKAPSKADAMAFLSQQQIVRPFYYVIVETPEGNYGKDKDGFYQE